MTVRNLTAGSLWHLHDGKHRSFCPSQDLASLGAERLGSAARHPAMHCAAMRELAGGLAHCQGTVTSVWTGSICYLPTCSHTDSWDLIFVFSHNSKDSWLVQNWLGETVLWKCLEILWVQKSTQESFCRFISLMLLLRARKCLCTGIVFYKIFAFQLGRW